MKFKTQYSYLPAVALLAGIAAGTAIAALFAPKSGAETRSSLQQFFTGLLESQPAKEIEISDHLVDDLRAEVKKHADHLTGEEGEKVDPVKHTLKQTGPKSRQLPPIEG